jgi:hypothetical protein
VKEVTGPHERKEWQKLWEKVWREEGYDQPGGLSVLREHYGQFDQYSRDLILTLFWRWPIGTVRLILCTPDRGTPTLNDFAGIDPRLKKFLVNSGKTIEVTLLTIDRRFRDLLLPFLVLLKGVYKEAKRMGGEFLVMACDIRLFRTLAGMLPGLKTLGESKFYEGSYTVPALLSISQAEESLQESDPSLYRFFIS